MKRVYLLIGVPASGKSWVSLQLSHRFKYIPHDDFIDRDYIGAILDASENAELPVLCETPFSVSRIMEPLRRAGAQVVPVFIFEDESILTQRYFTRERKAYLKGNVTRQETYRKYCREWGSFCGTAEAVLAHLKGIDL